MEWEKRRLIAANMFEQGLSTKVIAASLEVDDQTVRRWRRAFEASGRAGLLSTRHKGRPARLDAGQKRQDRFEADDRLAAERPVQRARRPEYGVSLRHGAASGSPSPTGCRSR